MALGGTIEEAIFLHESVIRGHHVYKSVCGEILQVEQEFGNSHNAYSVALMKDELVVGHVPRENSRLFW